MKSKSKSLVRGGKWAFRSGAEGCEDRGFAGVPFFKLLSSIPSRLFCLSFLLHTHTHKHTHMHVHNAHTRTDFLAIQTQHVGIAGGFARAPRRHGGLVALYSPLSIEVSQLPLVSRHSTSTFSCRPSFFQQALSFQVSLL